MRLLAHWLRLEPLLIALLSVALLPALLPVTRAAADPDIIPGSYIVVYRDDIVAASAVTELYGNQSGIEITNVYSHALYGFAADLSPARVKQLQSDPRVETVIPVPRRARTAPPSPTMSEPERRARPRRRPVSREHTWDCRRAEELNSPRRAQHLAGGQVAVAVDFHAAAGRLSVGAASSGAEVQPEVEGSNMLRLVPPQCSRMNLR